MNRDKEITIMGRTETLYEYELQIRTVSVLVMVCLVITNIVRICRKR